MTKTVFLWASCTYKRRFCAKQGYEFLRYGLRTGEKNPQRQGGNLWANSRALRLTARIESGGLCLAFQSRSRTYPVFSSGQSLWQMRPCIRLWRRGSSSKSFARGRHRSGQKRLCRFGQISMESVLPTITATQNPKTKNAPIRCAFLFGLVNYTFKCNT